MTNDNQAAGREVMGQAKKRSDEIKALKALGKLKAPAVHESAHVIAAMHFDVPIGDGDGGVWLKEHDGRVSGSSDARPTILSMGELADNRQFFLEHQAMNFAGPFAEFFFLWGDRVIERGFDMWLSDFARVMGMEGTKVGQGKVFYSGEQLKELRQIASRCFALLVDKATEVGPVAVGDKNVGPLIGEAVLGTRKLVRAYWQDILNFSDVLLASPGLAMTKARVDEWATVNFRRQNEFW
jgi:hypothetical protein